MKCIGMAMDEDSRHRSSRWSMTYGGKWAIRILLAIDFIEQQPDVDTHNDVSHCDNLECPKARMASVVSTNIVCKY